MNVLAWAVIVVFALIVVYSIWSAGGWGGVLFVVGGTVLLVWAVYEINGGWT